MNIALFFGSFNPIHIGHLIMANQIATLENIDQVWLVISPHNPHKDKKTLLSEHHRLQLVRVAIENNPKLYASDIEFNMEQPSYTVKTLAHLKEKYPNNTFSLVMGEDNLRSLPKWYNADYIIKNHEIIVYPRSKTVQEDKLVDIDLEFTKNGKITILTEKPMLQISSSFIRKSIQNKKDIRYLVSEPVFNYIDEMNFYK